MTRQIQPRMETMLSIIQHELDEEEEELGEALDDEAVADKVIELLNGDVYRLAGTFKDDPEFRH